MPTTASGVCAKRSQHTKVERVEVHVARTECAMVRPCQSNFFFPSPRLPDRGSVLDTSHPTLFRMPAPDPFLVPPKDESQDGAGHNCCTLENKCNVMDAIPIWLHIRRDCIAVMQEKKILMWCTTPSTFRISVRFLLSIPVFSRETTLASRHHAQHYSRKSLLSRSIPSTKRSATKGPS